MADELSNVQANQGVNPLWPLGAAVIGGGATHYGLNKAGYYSSPYKSVEDLIKEKEDTFNGKKVNGDAQQKAADKAKSSIETAAAKYDADLKAYQSNPVNANSLVETPEYKKLVEAQETAEKALADKRAELEKVGGDVKSSVVPPKAQQALDKVNKEIEAETKRLEEFGKVFNSELKKSANSLYEAINKVEDLEAQVRDAIRDKKPEAEVDALKAQLKTARTNLSNMEKLLDSTINTAAESMVDSKRTKSEVVAKRAAKAKEIKTTIQDIIAERTHNESVIKDNIKELQAKKVKGLKDIKSAIGLDISTMDSAEANKQVGRHLKVEEAKLAKLEKFKAIFAEAENKAKISGGETTLVEEISKLLGIYKKTKTSTTVKTAENAFAESLSKEEAETFARLVKGNGGKAIDKAIEESKQRIETLNTSMSNINATNTQFEELGGKGAYYKKGTLRSADGKVVKFKPEQIKLSNDVEIPTSSKLAGLQKQKASIEAGINKAADNKLSAAQIEEKLAKETKAVADAKAAVEKARGGLVKGEAKTPEQLAKEYAEKYGTKRDAITKALKESEAELKPLFEKKWGNGKVAAAIAGGAAIAGLLGYIIAPSRKS